MDFYGLTILSLAVAAASMTITKSNAMIWFRNLFVDLATSIHDANWVEEWSADLIHCPYCLSHSLAAFGMLSWFRGSLIEMILTWLAVVAFASLVSLGITLFFLALDALDRSE